MSERQPDSLPSSQLVREMLTPQIATPKYPLGDSYGLGIHLVGEGENQGAFHTGATWGSYCIFWFYPELGEGAVIMTNKAAGQGNLSLEILLGIASVYGWPIDL